MQDQHTWASQADDQIRSSVWSKQRVRMLLAGQCKSASTNVSERPNNVRTVCNCGVFAGSQQSCATGLSPVLAVTLFARSALCASCFFAFNVCCHETARTRWGIQRQCLYLHVRRKIADTTDVTSCIDKELPICRVPIVANIKNQEKRSARRRGAWTSLILPRNVLLWVSSERKDSRIYN